MKTLYPLHRPIGAREIEASDRAQFVDHRYAPRRGIVNMLSWRAILLYHLAR